MLWFDLLALVSSRLLNLSKVLSESVAGLAHNAHCVTTGLEPVSGSYRESRQHTDSTFDRQASNFSTQRADSTLTEQNEHLGECGTGSSVFIFSCIYLR